MNLKKAFFLFVLVALVVRFGAAQHKEEFFGPHEPIKSIQIFPNPAVDYVSVKLDNPDIRKSKIALHNIIGSPMEFESEVIDDHELRIRVKDFPTGYYFLSVRDEHSQSRGTFKFLKR